MCSERDGVCGDSPFTLQVLPDLARPGLAQLAGSDCPLCPLTAGCGPLSEADSGQTVTDVQRTGSMIAAAPGPNTSGAFTAGQVCPFRSPGPESKGIYVTCATLCPAREKPSHLNHYFIKSCVGSHQVVAVAS